MKIPENGIVVDGSTRGNPGPSEYRGIDLQTGEVLFHQKIGVATNNVTEYLALAHALLYCSEREMNTTIYSDSQTALSWLKKGKINSSLPLNERTKKAIEYLSRANFALSVLDIKFDGLDLKCNDIVITKWYTSEYGEIPADFGLKA